MNAQCPSFIFIGYEFLSSEDSEDSKGKVNSSGTINLLSFNREKNNLSTIKSIIKEEFEVFNTKYLLRGLICCPFAGHYNGLIINLLEDFHVLKKNNNYFYDDRLNNNEILSADILKH